MEQGPNQLKSILEARGEVTKMETATHLTSGAFLSLPRNRLPMGIFIFWTEYLLNAFDLIQRKKKTCCP